MKEYLTQMNNTRTGKLNSKTRVRQKVLVVLAIILMVATYAPPSGLHLKFCIGEDGHWDISAVACASEQQTPISKHSHANPTDHHGECTDFTTACDEKEICKPTSALFSRNPSSKILPLTPVANASGIIPQPAIKPSVFQHSSSEISFSLPAYLRSVVLLI